MQSLRTAIVLIVQLGTTLHTRAGKLTIWQLSLSLNTALPSNTMQLALTVVPGRLHKKVKSQQGHQFRMAAFIIQGILLAIVLHCVQKCTTHRLSAATAAARITLLLPKELFHIDEEKHLRKELFFPFHEIAKNEMFTRFSQMATRVLLNKTTLSRQIAVCAIPLI